MWLVWYGDLCCLSVLAELQAFKWRDSLCCFIQAVAFDGTLSALTSARRVYHFCMSEESEMIQKQKAPPYRHLDCQFISQSACKFFLFFFFSFLYTAVLLPFLPVFIFASRESSGVWERWTNRISEAKIWYTEQKFWDSTMNLAS